MSMNKYMHPRNIYKKQADFRQLALEFPTFRQYVTQDLKGKVKIDFKDDNALRALTWTLLKKDFDLDVNIPKNKLIPTVPLRLNYILWIEDLMSIAPNKNGSIVGIDIGTGSTCVYPLLAAKKYGWKMIGTEINPESFKYAQENIARNNLNELVEVCKNQEDFLMYDVVIKKQAVDFTMCNPPFFASMEDLSRNKGRSLNRPKPKNAFCFESHEVTTNGGELKFLMKMAEESNLLREKVRIYTSMIGHKSNLSHFKKFLRDIHVVSFKQTEFCQGNTTRWGIAWTFCNIDLRKVPESTLEAWRKEKKSPVFSHKFSFEGDVEISMEKVDRKIQDVMKGLLIDFNVFSTSSKLISYNISAMSNTWSNQRRMRRAKARLLSTLSSEASKNEEMEVERSTNNNETDTKLLSNTVNLLKELNVKQFSENNVDCSEKCDVFSENNRVLSENNASSSTSDCSLNVSNGSVQSTTEKMDVLNTDSNKRSFSDDEIESDGYFNSKKLRVVSPDTPKALLEAMLVIKVISVDSFTLDLSFIKSSQEEKGKDLLHQVMQYFINNVKF